MKPTHITTERDPGHGFVSIAWDAQGRSIATGHGYTRPYALQALRDNLLTLEHPTGLPIKLIRQHTTPGNGSR